MIAALQHHEASDMQALGNDLLRWWWQGAGQPLERVLGLRPAPGQRSPNTVARLAQRDVLIRALAAAHYPGRSLAAAEAMRRAWARYASSGWPRDRQSEEVPSYRVGKPEAWFWQIMRLQDQVPAERTIRRILATS